MTLTLFFHTFNEATPYICGQRPISYECDGKEGVIFFNGYYYVENHAPPYPEDDLLKRWEIPRRYNEWLPKEALLFVKEEEGEKVIQDHLYRVEISRCRCRCSAPFYFWPSLTFWGAINLQKIRYENGGVGDSLEKSRHS